MKNQKMIMVFALMVMTAFYSNAKNVAQLPELVSEYSDASSIVDAYLGIKNSLVGDDEKKAAEFGHSLANAVNEFDTNKYPNSEVSEILEVIKEHGEHIAKSEISHQREHFAELANEIKDLIKITGTGVTLYAQYCPMYDNNKGGLWLSTSEEIKNPYFGSKMLKCGSVKEVIEKN